MKGVRIGSKQERFMRQLSMRYISLTDAVRSAGLDWPRDQTVVTALFDKGLVLVSDNKHPGDRVIRITVEGERRLNYVMNTITGQELTDEWPPYLGLRQRQVMRLFRRTPIITLREMAQRLGIELRHAEKIVSVLYRYQLLTNVDEERFTLANKGNGWLDFDCFRRGLPSKCAKVFAAAEE